MKLLTALPTTTLDLCGLKCPLPVLKTDARLKQMAAGQILCVLTTDPLARLDLANLVQQRGDALLQMERLDGTDVFLIRKEAAKLSE